MRFPFGSLRTLTECLSVPFPAGLPGIIGPFPFLAPFLLLPAAVACTVIRLPCCKLPNLFDVIEPPKTQLNLCRADASSGYSYGPYTVVHIFVNQTVAAYLMVVLSVFVSNFLLHCR